MQLVSFSLTIHCDIFSYEDIYLYCILLMTTLYYTGFPGVSGFPGGLGFPGGSDGKASAYNAGDLGSIPGLGRSPGEGNGNPLQYSCLKNPMDRGT